MEKLDLNKLAEGLQKGLSDTNTFEFFDEYKNLKNKTGVKDFVRAISSIRPQPCNDNKQLNLTEPQAIEIVKNFYYSIGLKDEVDKIILDKSTYKLDISNKNNSSYVNQSGNNSFLDVVIGFNGDLIGLRNIAHEFAHAMSNHHLQRISLIKANKSIKDYNAKMGEFNHDCVGEIESHIIELLFNDYLCNQGLISIQDIENFNTAKLNSLFNNCKLIYEEKDIVESINHPITELKLKLYLAKCTLKGTARKQLDRIKFINERLKIDPNAFPKKRFRYVVGEIVSNNFYQNFINSNEDKKQKLLKTFKTYLTKTDSLTVDESVNMLVDKNLSQCFETYATSLDEKLNIL